MSLKLFLLLMTAIAVVSDSMLHPFYPQYFAEVFGVHDSMHVGIYIASCSLTVIFTFPLWAMLARRVPVLPLMIATQLATCALSLSCYTTTSLPAFWALSLAMMVFKASYLLIYPYVMSLDGKEGHLGTISLLAVVVYFGNIMAALLSGAVFELVDARFLFVAMALGDVLQIALCLAMWRSEPGARAAEETTPGGEEPSSLTPSYLLRLGAVMLVLYFSAYVSDPFFSRYWEVVSARENKLLTGAVFAIPGAAALLGLYLNARVQSERAGHGGVAPALVLGICGLLLQLAAEPWAVLAGRFMFGWALFQSMVRLDALLFRHSTPETYAVDFSKVNLFQGVGVLIAAGSAGALHALSIQIPFVLAAVGFALGIVLYLSLFREELREDLTAANATGATTTIDEGSATT